MNSSYHPQHQQNQPFYHTGAANTPVPEANSSDNQLASASSLSQQQQHSGGSFGTLSQHGNNNNHHHQQHRNSDPFKSVNQNSPFQSGAGSQLGFNYSSLDWNSERSTSNGTMGHSSQSRSSGADWNSPPSLTSSNSRDIWRNTSMSSFHKDASNSSHRNQQQSSFGASNSLSANNNSGRNAPSLGIGPQQQQHQGTTPSPSNSRMNNLEHAAPQNTSAPPSIHNSSNGNNYTHPDSSPYSGFFNNNNNQQQQQYSQSGTRNTSASTSQHGNDHASWRGFPTPTQQSSGGHSFGQQQTTGAHSPASQYGAVQNNNNAPLNNQQQMYNSNGAPQQQRMPPYQSFPHQPSSAHGPTQYGPHPHMNHQFMGMPPPPHFVQQQFPHQPPFYGAPNGNPSQQNHFAMFQGMMPPPQAVPDNMAAPDNAFDASTLEKQLQAMLIRPPEESKMQTVDTSQTAVASNNNQKSVGNGEATQSTETPPQKSPKRPSITSIDSTKKGVQKLFFARGRPSISPSLRRQHEPVGKFLPVKKVTKMVNKLYSQLKPDDSEVERKENFVRKISKLVQNKWPKAELHVFGSSRSGLSLKGNADVDLCLVIDYRKQLDRKVKLNEERFLRHKEEKLRRKEERARRMQERQSMHTDDEIYSAYDEIDEVTPITDHDDDSIEPAVSTDEKDHEKILTKSIKQLQKEYINQLTQLFKHRRMRQVKGIFTSRVPIVKFIGNDSNYQCDICVNHGQLGIVNSTFLKDYCDIDDRVRPLAYSIKHWSKKRSLNDARHGTLSSYAYMLLLVHYLQNTSPPVLPVLHDMDQFKSSSKIKKNVITINKSEYDCTYFNRVDLIKNKSRPEWKCNNRESLGGLLAGFFKYYAWYFNFDEYVVSVRTTALVTKEDKQWTADKRERSEICIEDPFERHFNVGRSVWKPKKDDILNEMVRAYYMLNSGADWESVVCEQL